MNHRPTTDRGGPLFRWGLGLVAALLVGAVLAPLLSPYVPGEQVDPAVSQYRPPGTVLAAVHLSYGWKLADRVERTPEGLRLYRLERTEDLPAAAVRNLTPEGVADSRRFLLGSDKFGRDLLSRMIHGTRVSLGVALGSVLMALTLGLAVGSAAALGGPVIDGLLMRMVDALLSFPTLFLLIVLAAFFQPSTLVIVIILATGSWMGISRLIRAEILSLQSREFVLAARAMGQRPFAILIRHLLPNAFTPALIQATLLVGQLILVESTLSFLGLGIQPPTPSWGNMIAEGREALARAWWVATFPGIAIAVTVIAFNFLGDGLRDALDPRQRRGVGGDGGEERAAEAEIGAPAA